MTYFRTVARTLWESGRRPHSLPLGRFAAEGGSEFPRNPGTPPFSLWGLLRPQHAFHSGAPVCLGNPKGTTLHLPGNQKQQVSESPGCAVVPASRPGCLVLFSGPFLLRSLISFFQTPDFRIREVGVKNAGNNWAGILNLSIHTQALAFRSQVMLLSHQGWAPGQGGEELEMHPPNLAVLLRFPLGGQDSGVPASGWGSSDHRGHCRAGRSKNTTWAFLLLSDSIPFSFGRSPSSVMLVTWGPKQTIFGRHRVPWEA